MTILYTLHCLTGPGLYLWHTSNMTRVCTWRGLMRKRTYSQPVRVYMNTKLADVRKDREEGMRVRGIWCLGLLPQQASIDFVEICLVFLSGLWLENIWVEVYTNKSKYHIFYIGSCFLWYHMSSHFSILLNTSQYANQPTYSSILWIDYRGWSTFYLRNAMCPQANLGPLP